MTLPALVQLRDSRFAAPAALIFPLAIRAASLDCLTFYLNISISLCACLRAIGV
jgi:hypothetical protein